jgi:hypothetical protein
MGTATSDWCRTCPPIAARCYCGSGWPARNNASDDGKNSRLPQAVSGMLRQVPRSQGFEFLPADQFQERISPKAR